MRDPLPLPLSLSDDEATADTRFACRVPDRERFKYFRRVL
jgi:hypothetical protein